MEQFEFGLYRSNRVWSEKLWCDDKYAMCFEILREHDMLSADDIKILEDLSYKYKYYNIGGWCVFSGKKRGVCTCRETDLVELCGKVFSQDRNLTHLYYISPDKQDFSNMPLTVNGDAYRAGLIYRLLTETELTQSKVNYVTRLVLSLANSNSDEIFTCYLFQLALEIYSKFNITANTTNKKVPVKGTNKKCSSTKNKKVPVGTKGGKKSVRKN